MARRRPTGFVRKEKEWNGIPGARVILSGNGTSQLGGSLAFASNITVMRFLGEYTMSPSSAPVAGDAVRITIGMAVLATDVVSVGASAFPDPEEEPEFPWLYWASHPLIFADTSLDPSTASGSVRHTFDIRSMRKLNPRQSIALAVQYADVVGTPAIHVALGGIRVLVALP